MKNLFTGLALASTIAVIAVSAAAITPAAVAHDTKKERSVEGKYRHDVMEQVKYAASGVRILARGYDGGQSDAMALNIENLLNAAKLSKGAFKADTHTQEAYTEASADIWTNWADFEGRLDTFIGDIETLKAAEASGNEAGFRSAFRAVFSNCKSCHKNYKTD